MSIQTVIMDFDEQHEEVRIYFDTEKQYQRYGLQAIETCEKYGFKPLLYVKGKLRRGVSE